MAEELTVIALISRGISVITSYFSNYINDYVLETNKDFEMLIIVGETIILWTLVSRILTKLIHQIWTIKKYELWKNVITSSFGFISLMLVFLLFRIFFDKLGEASRDVNLNIGELFVLLYTIIICIYFVFFKAKKYSDTK